MNKLENIKNKASIIGFDYENKAFRKGFDAVIALDLPVKFLKWKRSNVFEDSIKGPSNPRKPYIINKYDGKGASYFNEEELYQYWITYIWKP